jgi:phage-related protein
MSSFPVLSTGAVAQYPASRTFECATRVLVFVDGSEQRFRQTASPERRWTIRLEKLNDEEMAAIEAFLAGRQGSYGSFAFTDPWTHGVPGLQPGTDEAPLNYRNLLRGGATLVVARTDVTCFTSHN